MSRIRILWLITMLSLLTASAKAKGPERVLLIHSFGRDFAPFSDLAAQFRTELARQCPEPVEFLDVSLEMARFEGVNRDTELMEFLAAICAEGAPDLVVCSGAPALQFFLKYHGERFQDVPLLAIGVDRRRLESVSGVKELTAVGLDLGLDELLQNILGVLPETRHVYVVMGVAPLEKFWQQELMEEWPGLAKNITFHWLSDQSLQQMQETVKRLPQNSAIFVGILNRDAAGIPHVFETGLAAIRAAAAVPVFGYTEQQLGLGILGGRLIPMRQVARNSAEVAVKILAGIPASSMEMQFVPLSTPAYDARELEHWRISESALPSGSRVIFREPGLWESHRGTVILVVVVTIVQTTLIILLLAARRRAREMDANLGLAADAANVGLWQRNVTSGEIIASPKWRSIFGLPPTGRLKISDVLDRLHPRDASKVRRAVSHAVEYGQSYDIEHRIVLPDGSVRWIASTGCAEKGYGNRPIRTRGASRDITERKRIEWQLEEQRRQLAHLSRAAMLNTLSGSLAHELNQPLGIILSNAQAAEALLDQDPPELAEIRSILADIVKADHRAGEVIKRLRAFLKRGELKRQAHDPGEIVKEVLQLVRKDLIERDVTVEQDLALDLPSVRCDRVQLQQVILNLILNACDAMSEKEPTSRRLEISTSRLDRYVRVSVRDTGCGLPADVESIFRPFVTTKKHGLGLGLAISHSIVEAHRGRLSAEPRSKGASFHMELPVEEEKLP